MADRALSDAVTELDRREVVKSLENTNCIYYHQLFRTWEVIGKRFIRFKTALLASKVRKYLKQKQKAIANSGLLIDLSVDPDDPGCLMPIHFLSREKFSVPFPRRSCHNYHCHKHKLIVFVGASRVSADFKIGRKRCFFSSVRSNPYRSFKRYTFRLGLMPTI